MAKDKEDQGGRPTKYDIKFCDVAHKLAADGATDAVNSQFAFKSDIGQVLKAAADTTSIWIAAVCRSGTPTYSASGIKLKIGVKWD